MVKNVQCTLGLSRSQARILYSFFRKSASLVSKWLLENARALENFAVLPYCLSTVVFTQQINNIYEFNMSPLPQDKR